MATRIVKTSPMRVARTAGFLYLLVVPLGIFGLMTSGLVVPGEAAATTSNIMGSELLFRLGIVSDLLAPIALILVVLQLYELLGPVNRNMARLMVAFLLAGASIGMLNKLNQFAALEVLSGSDYLKTFSSEQLESLAYLFLRLHSRGSNIAYLFWGLWLFPLGWLVFKSGFLPRILGILLMMGCFAYLTDSFARFLGYTVNIGMLAALGEVAFILWLLIKGVNAEQWEQRASGSN
jgi:hypothetical protein